MERPSLSSSPWRRGAPQRGFAWLMVRIRWRRSPAMGLRPRWRRLFQRQNQRNAWRCQPMTVSGCTITRGVFQWPELGEPDPEAPVPGCDSRAFAAGLKDQQLLAQRQVFDQKVGAGLAECAGQLEEQFQACHHGESLGQKNPLSARGFDADGIFAMQRGSSLAMRLVRRRYCVSRRQATVRPSGLRRRRAPPSMMEV